MKRVSLFFFVAGMWFGGSAAFSQTYEIRPEDPANNLTYTRDVALSIFNKMPKAMPGSETDTEARINLGKKLFLDPILSGSNFTSCNSCHDLSKNGADHRPRSTGDKGETLERNTPTVFNAGFQFAQFWDGRAANLKEQAKAPILDPKEMAMKTEEDVLAKLNGHESYPDLFKQAFPKQDPAVTFDNLAEAIAAFERTLITRTRFDDFLDGNDEALTPFERKGIHTFISTGCSVCHKGPLIGGESFDVVGRVAPFPNRNDKGRQAVTGREEDAFRFKVPSLRHVAQTAPYFHDGSIFTLEEAVRQMAWIQLGRTLSDREADEILAFLKLLSPDKPPKGASEEAAPSQTTP